MKTFVATFFLTKLSSGESTGERGVTQVSSGVFYEQLFPTGCKSDA